MKKISSKKGFSLIELIVVIAVFAAIAAVIVPSITNFNEEARDTSADRNVQLWNQTYLEAAAAGATGLPNALTDDTHCPEIAATADVGGTTVTFNAPAFDTVDAGTMTFDAAANPPLVFVDVD
jgi:prepilin-type N-terminal cleavage/methylation domain-containing protein